MTQSLRALLAADGISVHAVVLGPIDTEMSRVSRSQKPRPSRRQPVSSRDWRKAKTKSFPIRPPRPSPMPGATARSRPWSASSPLWCRRPPPWWREVESLLGDRARIEMPRSIFIGRWAPRILFSLQERPHRHGNCAANWEPSLSICLPELSATSNPAAWLQDV